MKFRWLCRYWESVVQYGPNMYVPDSELFRLPPLPNIWVVLLVLVAALVIFHVLFLKLFRLPEVWWKKVDYIWLSMTVLGLIGATSQARQVVATDLFSTAASCPSDRTR